MNQTLYNFFVRKNEDVQYEYERYVREHMEEHYENRRKQWKILMQLNWHYRIQKKQTPLIYWEREITGGSGIEYTYNEFIMPGVQLCEKILFGHEEGTRIFLCPYVGTGDVYLASMYMNAYAKKNKIEHFIVAVIGGANYKIASLFSFQEIVKIDQGQADQLIRLSVFLGEDNTKIISMHHHAPQVYGGIMENMRNINKLNFMDLFLYNVFHLDPYEDRELPKFDNGSSEIRRLFEVHGLEEGNTVVLSPYVYTLPGLPWWVWANLAQRLKNIGYVVCTNCGNPNEKEIEGTIPLHFDIGIAVPMLEKCGYFIGVRSGFCDVVSTAKCKKIIIYQPYIFWGAGTNFDYFSLKTIGFCDDAIELEYTGVEFLDLIDNVVEGVEKKEMAIADGFRKKRHTIDYIIVQAGGKGTRLGYLTRNKPKALVPIDNLPMLFHLFHNYPDKKFVIVGDYKCDVLKRYLEAFAEVDYVVVDAGGKEGTCGGLRQALEHIPEETPFMLIWSDLVLPKDFSLKNLENGNYVGISGSFPCRWKFEDHQFVEERSSSHGVAGLFAFRDKQLLEHVPESGEFVRWLSENDQLDFNTVVLSHTNEYGILDEYEKLDKSRCRPFNRLETVDHVLIKKGITEQGRQLGKREVLWYKQVIGKRFDNLPRIYAFEPLIMERIAGKNIYEYTTLGHTEKQKILKQIVDCLKHLHRIGEGPFDRESFDEAYIGKTMERLEKVKKLVPFANEPSVTVNGKKCRNIFYHVEEVRNMINRFIPERFVFLHGDCTFSNIMMREDGTPVLIDPRGYFGKTELYGDAAYDWSKLYYSIVGNYDQFNLKRFRLEIKQNEAVLEIESSGWEDMEDYFFELIGQDTPRTQIKLIHAIIWLSLTTYAWEDYDSICGAFYNGLYYLEEVL